MTYRRLVNASDLKSFKLIVKETNLLVLFNPNSSKIPENWKDIVNYSLLNCRRQIEDYIKNYPCFGKSYIPVEVEEKSPLIVREMAEASLRVNIGPMAAVAGAVAEFVGKEILKFSDEVIVENGGDIFLKSNKRRTVAIYAGENSPFSGKIALEINSKIMPIGICCSSGTFGHSYSFGKANGSVAVAVSTALADVSATAIGNLIQAKSDLSKGIEFAKKIPGLLGSVIIKEDKIAIWGKVKIIEL